MTKRIRPETIRAVGEMVTLAARAQGLEADAPVEFTVCGARWCAGSEALAHEGDTDFLDYEIEDLDFESLDAGQPDHGSDCDAD